MADPLLSQREFDTWREGDEAFKQQLLTHMQNQVAHNLNHEGRLATVEAKQEECASKMSTRTTWISSIVSAVVGGLVGAFTGRA